MQKFEWKVRAILKGEDLESFAAALEEELNLLEKDGFEVQKMEIKNEGILLTGRKPARRAA